MKPKIRINDLNFYYGNYQALLDINIDVFEKKVTALIGPSGCGKTTFLRTLNRLHELMENTRVTGEIIYESDENILISNDVVDIRTKIGMVFQKPNPFPMSIYENVAYGPKCSGVKNKEELNEIVKEALINAGLWDEVKDKLNQSGLSLSGGQQQRLCIARAIALKPEVLLMDEPTSALDPIATEKIENLIIKLKNNYTIIIVTHSLHQAARISDYIAFFLRGELVESGPTSTIFKNAKNKSTSDYITGKYG